MEWGWGVHVRYYVLHWFYAEVYHILELSCMKQVEPGAAPAVRFVPDREQTSDEEFQKEAAYSVLFS